MTHEYRAAPGAMFNDDEAQAMGEFIRQFSDDHGGVNPKDLLAAAQGSPLEARLEWDNVIAANKHRLHQIYDTLIHIEAVIKAPDGSERYHRAFYPTRIIVSFDGGDEQPIPVIISAYYPTEQILADPVLREQQVEWALNRFRSARKTFSELKELRSIFEAIDAYELEHK